MNLSTFTNTVFKSEVVFFNCISI